MQISNSEKILMDVLWANATETNPIPAKQIIREVVESVDWHEKTIKTLLNRLLKKKVVGFNKSGREYLYYPILRQQDFVVDAADSFVKRVFNGSVSSLVAAFAKQEKISEQDLIELKSIIKQMEQKGN